MVYSPNA